MKKFGKVVVGGTFDRLHLGHKALLRKAFEVGKVVYIGLTSDEMIRNKPGDVLPYGLRLRDLLKFLDANNYTGYRVIKIHDAVDFAGEMRSLEAIVVSEETYRGALMVNRAREERGLRPLAVVVIPMVKGPLGRISSTLIRAGLMDASGRPLERGLRGKNPGTGGEGDAEGADYSD